MESPLTHRRLDIFLGLMLAILTLQLATNHCQGVTAVTVSPSTYTLGDVATPVTVQADTAAAGNELMFDVYIDVNADSTLDPEDQRFMSLAVADGQAPHLGNAGFWHDEDGETNSSVRATLIANGAWWFSGAFIVKVTDDDSSTDTTSLTVEQNTSHPCVVTGEVEFEGLPAGGVAVRLTDPATDQAVSADVTASDGTFVLRVKSPGSYIVIAMQPGSVTKFNEGSAQLLTVSQGGNSLPAPLVLFPGDRTISGRVFASDTGDGFRGILVFGQTEEFFAIAFTDDDGSYTLTVLDGEWGEISMAADIPRFGYVPPGERSITVSGDDVEGLDFPCARATTLVTGTVKDALTQEGLQGYEVQADSQNTGPDVNMITYSGSDGSYAFGVVEGDWEIEMNEGLPITTGYALPPSQHVTAPASGTVSGTDFLLEKAGTITGLVYEDDGVTPIEGASVDVHEFGTWNWVAYTETLPDGSYTLWVPSGTYMVRVFRVEGWQEQYYLNTGNSQEASPVVVTAPDETSGIDFVLVRAGAITGHVYQDDGVTPIEGASVDVHEFDTWNWVAYTETLPDGSYALWLPSGTYVVRVFQVEGWQEQYYLNAGSREQATPVVVTVPDETSGIDFVLVPTGPIITGHVYEDDGVTPIEGAHVGASLFGPSSEWVASDQTGADGSYRLAVPSGTYDVLVHDVPGWLDQYYDGVRFDDQATPVIVIEGQETAGIDFVLQPAAIISGHVYQADGSTPISGAGVSAFDEAIGKWVGTATGDDGSYSLRLPSGSYKVWANADAWVGEFYDNLNRIENATVITVVAPEERSGIDFALTEASATIKGHVYQEDGTTPIIAARVTAHVHSTGDYMGFTHAGDDGSYALPVPPGTFRVSTQAPRWHLQHYATPVTVTDSQVVENIDFSLQSTPFALAGVQWRGQWPGLAELKWLPLSGMIYSVYWTEQLKDSQTLWHEVPDAPDDFQQNDGYLVWSDNGTSPGMSGLAPGDPAVRQRYYRVLEEAQ